MAFCLLISANAKVNAQKKSTKVSNEYFSEVK